MHPKGYPKTVRLQTGTEVTLRPMVREDAGKLHDFFTRVPREDRLFLREDVSIRDVTDAWANELDYERVLPLLAEVGANIVGDATLHRRAFGWTSHIGKVRVVIDKDYRGKGLGTIMLEELVSIAKAARLEQLVAELIADQTAAIASFRRLGFEKEATFYNYVKDQTGEPRNLVVMNKNLQIEPAVILF
jgi:ribosomal protein S18 acetylase RimI-like enzyme